MPDQLSIEQFATEIKKRRPDLAQIPNDVLVGKTISAAPELKQFVNLDMSMPASEGIISQLFGHLGVQKSDPATPIVASGSQAGAPIINPMQPSVVSEGAAQALAGMGKFVAGIPSAAKAAIGMGLRNSPAEQGMALVDALKGAKDSAGMVTNPPPPESPQWQQAQQGAGASLVAAEMPNALSPLARALGNALPDVNRAGANFQTAMAGAKDVPLDLAFADDAARRALELGGRGRIIGRGNSMPKVVSDYVRQRGMLDPLNIEGNPMTYEVGRDFASAAGNLSASEKLAANGVMRRQVSKLAQALDEATQKAATQANVGEAHSAAMDEYRRAMIAKALAKNTLKAAAAGTTAYELHKILTRQ